jgi:hypothetical protein
MNKGHSKTESKFSKETQENLLNTKKKKSNKKPGFLSENRFS